MLLRLFSLTTLCVIGTIALVIVALVAQVGQLDEATSAFVQVLLIPVQVVGIFIAVISALIAGGLFESSQSTASQSINGTAMVVIVAIMTMVAAKLWGGELLAVLRRREERRRKLAQGRQVATERLVALAGAIRNLDGTSDLEANPVAVRCHLLATDAYIDATIALDKARRLEDLDPVMAALHKGRVAVVAATSELSS